MCFARTIYKKTSNLLRFKYRGFSHSQDRSFPSGLWVARKLIFEIFICWLPQNFQSFRNGIIMWKKSSITILSVMLAKRFHKQDVLPEKTLLLNKSGWSLYLFEKYDGLRKSFWSKKLKSYTSELLTSKCLASWKAENRLALTFVQAIRLL